MVDVNNVKIKAANLLLNRGIRFTIPNASIWDKLRKRHQIWIKPLRAGTIMEMSRLLLERGLDDESLTNLQLQTRINDIAEIIAVAVLNNEHKIPQQREKLSRRLLWLPAKELVKIYRHIDSLSGIMDFTNITNSLRHQSLMMLEKRMGQKKKGS